MVNPSWLSGCRHRFCPGLCSFCLGIRPQTLQTVPNVRDIYMSYGLQEVRLGLRFFHQVNHVFLLNGILEGLGATVIMVIAILTHPKTNHSKKKWKPKTVENFFLKSQTSPLQSTYGFLWNVSSLEHELQVSFWWGFQHCLHPHQQHLLPPPHHYHHRPNLAQSQQAADGHHHLFFCFCLSPCLWTWTLVWAPCPG